MTSPKRGRRIPPPTNVNWPQALKKLFTNTSVRQKDVAEEIGVSTSTVSRWLKGQDTPTGLNADLLRELLEMHAKESNAELLAEVAKSPKLLAVVNSHSDMVGFSQGLRDFMSTIGWRGWGATGTEDGVLRIIEITVVEHKED